jgi:hypothetical protein
MRTDYSGAGNDFSPGFPMPRSHRKTESLVCVYRVYGVYGVYGVESLDSVRHRT